MRSRWAMGALVLGLLAGCAQAPVSTAGEVTASASPSTATSSPRPSEPSGSKSPTQRAPGTTVVTGESTFGTILFDAAGQAIYIFDVETTTKPLCYDACADAWPPVLTPAAPQAGQGVKDSLLGTTPRADGTTQVTYGGHALYFYADEGKHQVKCHKVFLNGGNWYALQSDGNRAP